MQRGGRAIKADIGSLGALIELCAQAHKVRTLVNEATLLQNGQEIKVLAAHEGLAFFAFVICLFGQDAANLRQNNFGLAGL
jgi:hypothetical protein